MKRYVCSSVLSPWEGYCNYTASNPDWGYDASQLLERCGGQKGYVKFPRNDGNGYYRSQIVYLFKSEEQYNEFNQQLRAAHLHWHVDVRKYREIPEGAIIREM